jgi:serine/threonine protein kinase
MMPNINHIKEIYVKLLCYKLLKGLQKCHENNICHNKIDIKNIMFDNDFNPIIIHFSEASLINNKNFNKDFIGLGIVLAKLMTSGKFISYKYDKNKKRFVFIHKLGGTKKKVF